MDRIEFGDEHGKFLKLQLLLLRDILIVTFFGGILKKVVPKHRNKWGNTQRFAQLTNKVGGSFINIFEGLKT